MTIHHSEIAHRLLMRELALKTSILRISVAVANIAVILLWVWCH